MICPRCNLEYGVGYSPWCRDGHEAIRPGRGPDITYPGGLTLENMGHEPVTVYSESERQRIMKARGLRECVRHVPGSPHTSDWSGPSPHTLATIGEWLAARGATGAAQARKAEGPAQGGWIGVSEAPKTFGVGVELPNARISQER